MRQLQIGGVARELRKRRLGRQLPPPPSWPRSAQQQRDRCHRAWLRGRRFFQGAGVVWVVTLDAERMAALVGEVVVAADVELVGVVLVVLSGVVIVVVVVVVVVPVAVVVVLAVEVVVAGVLCVTVVEPVVLFALVEPPKNVVDSPVPVIERPATSSGTVNKPTTIANASSPVMSASRQRGRDRSPSLYLIGPHPASRELVAGSSTGSSPGRRPELEPGSPRTDAALIARFRSLFSASVRLRAPGPLCTAGIRFALAATDRTGRRKNSETSATITGVAAALTSVPCPRIREAASAAAADARLAIISVSTEMPLPGRLSLCAAL